MATESCFRFLLTAIFLAGGAGCGERPYTQPVQGEWVKIRHIDAAYAQVRHDSGCFDAFGEECVRIAFRRGFKIFSTETSTGEFLRLMSYLPPLAGPASLYLPVAGVTWHEAARFCNALSEEAGTERCYTCAGTGAQVTCTEAISAEDCWGYRLPFEREWWHAYQYSNGGLIVDFYTTNLTSCLGYDPEADRLSWYGANSANTLHPSGLKPPNTNGLYDMPGNLEEWSHDTWGPKPECNWLEKVNPPHIDRALKGGHFNSEPHELRGAARRHLDPTTASRTIGFRCVIGIKDLH